MKETPKQELLSRVLFCSSLLVLLGNTALQPLAIPVSAETSDATIGSINTTTSQNDVLASSSQKNDTGEDNDLIKYTVTSKITNGSNLENTVSENGEESKNTLGVETNLSGENIIHRDLGKPARCRYMVIR